MAVQLFKAGGWQIFNEYTFTDALAAGWSLTEDASPVVVEEDKQPEPVVEVTDDLDSMTKKELEVHARKFNDKNGKPIELDRRMNKANMVKAFNEQKG